MQEEEELDEEERKQAWQEYEHENLERRSQMNLKDKEVLGNENILPQPTLPEVQSICEVKQNNVRVKQSDVLLIIALIIF